MGSTVTTRKLAAAFKSANGTVTFALFEESYSKNSLPPHTVVVLLVDRRHSTCDEGQFSRLHHHVREACFRGLAVAI